jgi:Glycosyl hydrolases family 39
VRGGGEHKAVVQRVGVNSGTDRHTIPKHRRNGTRIFVLLSLLPIILVGILLKSYSDGSFPASNLPGWGFTHTQFSAEHGSDDAIKDVQEALASQPLLQNQHIMGWGANNPEPEPDVYEFHSLDERMQFIRKSDGTPVITLCCAPDWMKGGASGETDWDELTTAPLPEHYSDFAELAGAVAERYPDVRHFIVWNEFKGFFDEENNRWNAEGYTDLYNEVYDAVKAVNPRNKIGGPYIPMDSYSPDWLGHASDVRGPWGTVDQRSLDAFDYWLEHKRGADFVVVDGHTTTRDESDLVTDEFTALAKLSAVSEWIESRTDLPLWWAEWYVEPDDADWSDEQHIAVRTAALIEFAKSGVEVALHWNPPPESEDCPGCLWTDTGSEDGGQPLPFLSVLQNFVRWFPSGTELETVSTDSNLRVLAQPRMLVVVNTQDSSVTTTIDEREVRLDPYEVRWLER